MGLSGTRRWRRVPALLQVETVECAAACLAMVLRAHGRWDAPQAVREACGASGQGTSAAAIVEAAASFGLDARAYRCGADDLARRPMPQILHWDDGHFVVLERMTAGGAVVCDPAHGRLRLDAAAFARRFRGVTITLVPGAHFTRTRRPPGLVRRLLPFLRGSLAEMGQLAFVAVAMAGLAILVPGFTRIYIDEYLVQDRGDWLIPLIGCMLAVALLQAGLAWLHGRGLLLIQTKITATVSAAVTWRTLRLPDGFFRRRGAVDVATRGALAGQVAGLIAGPFAGAITAGLSLAVYGLVMLAYSVELTAIVLILSLINLAVLWRLAGSMHEASCRVQMAASEAHAALVQGIAVLEQTRADAAEGALFERLMRTQLDQLNAEQASGLNGALTGAVPFLLGRLLTIAVLGAGSLLVLWTDFTVGALMGFVMLADLFAATLATLAAIGPSAAGASSALVRLDDLLDPPIPAWTTAAGDASGGLSLSGVTFAEGERAPILSGLDLAVRPGQVVGIAGTAGSGKTLLGGIIAGIVPPSAGTVRFDLRGGGSAEAGTCRGVALVETAPFLPAGTLRAALTLWAPDVTAEAVERALADADLLDVVRQRPGGIAGPVAEGGINFSGGERQRLGLARALLQSPSVVVLDDATSALDAPTEGRILAALRRRGLTLVLLTNRESALALCDTTLRLTDGRLAPLRIGAEHARAA